MSNPNRVHTLIELARTRATLCLLARSGERNRAVLRDLISDLGHWCDEHDVHYLHEIEAGLSNWLAERADPGGVEAGPRVEITLYYDDRDTSHDRATLSRYVP